MPCGSSKGTGNQDERNHCVFEDLDHSVLQQPLNLGVTNVKQILKCIQSGSKEVKDIILNECNIIYECKACDGLFRSLANLMYHKRCYCKKHLCEDMLLFEKFEEEEIVTVIPKPPAENSEKTEKFPEIPKLADCTVNIVKSKITERTMEIDKEKLETVNIVKSKSTEKIMEIDKEKLDSPSTSNDKNSDCNAEKGKKSSELGKTDSSMISRRTRNKNAQPAVKVISTDEPPIKCAKLISARIMVKDSNEKSNAGHKKGSQQTNESKDGKIKKISISKLPEKSNKTESQFPKVVFKTIDSNPHAVYQSSDKKKNNSLNAASNSPVKTKSDKDKLIIVLKKDAKSENPAPKSFDKIKSEMDKLSDFHLTRRKRLMSRNDCNVHELKCLTCKTQFMSLKTLYFHMLSLHSKKRLYYPCPFCKTLFVQMYGVTRHLISIHNKTKEQINKMRDIIKKKSVWKKIDDVDPTGEGNISTLTYEIKPQPQIEEKQVELPKPVESVKEQPKPTSDPPKSVIRVGKNVTLHPCGKCGRVFGRKSSQVSHEKFCIMNTMPKKENVDDPPVSFQPATSLPPPVLSYIPSPQKQTPRKTACVLQIKKTENTPVNKPAVDMPASIFNVKLSTRPKRGAEKQMHKDFVNSQTLKWRSANRVDTSVNSKPNASVKKVSGKNLEKKVQGFMSAEDLTCLKCDKKFSSFSNLRRHVAIHVGWTRFKCKYCDYQAYNKSQCWSHVQKSHAVEENEVEKCIVHLANSSPTKKIPPAYCTIQGKRNVNVTLKNAKSYSKGSKKKITSAQKKLISDRKLNQKKEISDSKKSKIESNIVSTGVKIEKAQTVMPVSKVIKKELPEEKKEKPRATITITKLTHKDNLIVKDKPQAMITIQKFPKTEIPDEKEKNEHVIPLQNINVSDCKKDSNYKSVTTSNPTTIILSKKTPSSTVQSIVTLSPDSVSSAKISQMRSSPRKPDGKGQEEKLITTLVTRSPGNSKITPIQIKLHGRSSSIDETPQDSGSPNYVKKEKLISEWFPKKDLTSTTNRRDSAPLIIGLVPAANSGVNSQTKNSTNASEDGKA